MSGANGLKVPLAKVVLRWCVVRDLNPQKLVSKTSAYANSANDASGEL